LRRISSEVVLILLLTMGFLTLKLVQPVESLDLGVLFFDDFDDGVADGWTEYSGSWSVIDGEYFTSIGIANSIVTVDDLTLSNCIIETRLRFTDSTGFRAGIVCRYTDNEHFYAFAISNEYDVAWMKIYTPEYPLYGYNNESMLAQIPVYPNINYTLRVQVHDGTFTGFLDDQELVSWTDGNYTIGNVGLLAHRADVFFDDFRVLRHPLTVPDDYGTIHEAINNANEGDTIFVRN